MELWITLEQKWCKVNLNELLGMKHQSKNGLRRNNVSGARITQDATIHYCKNGVREVAWRTTPFRKLVYLRELSHVVWYALYVPAKTEAQKEHSPVLEAASEMKGNKRGVGRPWWERLRSDGACTAITSEATSNRHEQQFEWWATAVEQLVVEHVTWIKRCTHVF